MRTDAEVYCFNDPHSWVDRLHCTPETLKFSGNTLHATTRNPPAQKITPYQMAVDNHLHLIIAFRRLALRAPGVGIPNGSSPIPVTWANFSLAIRIPHRLSTLPI